VKGNEQRIQRRRAIFFIHFHEMDKLFLKLFGIRFTLDPTCLTEKGSATEAFVIACHNNKNKKIISLYLVIIHTPFMEHI